MFGGGFDAGASQFGGGGFMASPAPGQANQFGGGGGGQKGRSQHNSLRALTVRHLIKQTANTEDDSFTADGQELSTVTIVGRVMSYQEQATRILLQVHDGTASVEVCSWMDDADSQKRVDWQVGKYVRVYGNVKSFGGKRSVTAFTVKPVTDHNEVTYHFLQCVMQHLHLTKGPPPAGQAAGGVGAAPAGTGAYGGPAPAGGAYGGGAYGGAPAPAHAPAPAAGGDVNSDVKAVYNLPHATASANGLTVEQAVAELRGMGRSYTQHQVMKACEYLAAEGVLYSTCDDTTYKSCA